MRVVVCVGDGEAASWMDRFASALPGAALERRAPDAPARRDVAPADYLVMVRRCGEALAEHPRPKALFSVNAGVADLLALPGLGPGIPLVRVEDAGMAPRMVRYVLAVALRVLGEGDAYRSQQQRAQWQKRPVREPASLAVGVLGMGVIGGAIARALAGQGFAVRGHARRRHTVDGIACFAGDDELPAFLAGLDLLVNVLPHTPATVDLLDRQRLACLNRGAHVVNVGRGTTLVEHDLLALLEAGHLAGATLDVFRAEPLPPEHPFWRRGDVTVTPHVSGPTDPAATVVQIADKIRRLERGEAVTGVVDRERGY